MRHPSPTSRSMSRPPMKPEPPVTKALLSRSVSMVASLRMNVVRFDPGRQGGEAGEVRVGRAAIEVADAQAGSRSDAHAEGGQPGPTGEHIVAALDAGEPPRVRQQRRPGEPPGAQHPAAPVAPGAP